MSEKPILFSGPMVNAILAGRKTMTRRVLKPQPTVPFNAIFRYDDGWFTGDGLDGDRHEKLPVKYTVGDSLWVREAWAPLTALKHSDPGTQALADNGFYRADNSVHDTEISKWRPSIHMPRWASRISLEVTGVKAERLQDISRGDAMAEGCPFPNMQKGDDPREWFKGIWESINGPASWDANPWVAAYSFRVVRP